MKQEKIEAIIKKKVIDISQQCRNINTLFDDEQIHNFRVSVKSLRSFLRLQQLRTHNKGIKMPKKFKRLYHIAGIIREIQLEIKQFEYEKTAIPNYIVKLRETLQLQKNEWKKYYSEKVLRKLDIKLSGFKYKKIHPNILEQFIKDRIALIGAITHKTSPTDIQIHSVRKHIKDILYNTKTAERKWEDAHKRIEKIPVKKLDDLAGLIGNYNDKRITLEHVNAFPSQDMEENEKNTINKFRNRELNKQRKKKKSILKAARNYTGKITNGKS